MALRLFAALVFLLLPNLSLAAEPVQFPGSSWTIVPPPGFELRQTPIAMLFHPEKAIIMITDFGRREVTVEEYGAIGEEFDQNTPNHGRLDRVEAVEVDGRPAVLAHIRLIKRSADSVTLIVEGDRTSVMAVAAIPDKAKGVDRDAVLTALLSVREVDRDDAGRLADLPFVIGDLAGFRVTFIPMGSGVALTDGPVDAQDDSPNQGHVMVMGVDPGGQPVDFNADIEPARKRLMQQFPDARITSAEVRDTVAGPALVFEYDRTHAETSTELAGEARLRMAGPLLVISYSEYPKGNSGIADRLARLLDSIVAR